MEEIENITINEIRNEIVKFNNDVTVQKLENYYQTKSFSEIIGVSRKELAHSNFIAWLLNDKESHFLSKFPIEKFLELLATNCNENQFNKHRELFDSIIVKGYDIEDIEIKTEKSIQKHGRIDIYIEMIINYLEDKKRLKIVLENKVDTKEHSDQTLRYFEYFEKEKLNDDIILYVFLTPLSSLQLIELKEPECSCKEFIQINYQLIVDTLLSQILNKTTIPQTKSIINEYILSLSQPSLDSSDNELKKGLIMALGTNERELLTKFWENNQRLIVAAIYAASLDPEQDKETQEKINQLNEYVQVFTGSKRDRSLYSISYNGKLETSKIKKADIGLNTINILDKHKLIDAKNFDFLRSDTSCSFQLLKTLEEISETEKKYRKYKFQLSPEIFYNGQGYYVARNWGKDNTEKFIEKLSKKFPSLKYENHE